MSAEGFKQLWVPALLKQVVALHVDKILLSGPLPTLAQLCMIW